MTKPNYTHIHVLFDRTGSMQGRESDINGWYKTFFAEQKKIPGELTVSVAQFDDSGYDEIVPWSKVQDIPVSYELVPRGMTNLRDAVAKSIINLGSRLTALKEEDRPSKVAVVVHTDGGENASREFSQEMLKGLVKQQREVYSWEFTFLGADIDAFAGGVAMGFAANANLSSGNNSQGYMASALISSAGVARWRTNQTGSIGYTSEELNEAAETLSKSIPMPVVKNVP